MKRSFEKYCKDYENIENYDKAKKDNFKGWHCHHRLETHNSDGERRLVDISQGELKALEMYYDRPANELIFLTSREHNAYRKGRHLSEEHKKKVSEALEGKPKSEETRKKISEARKGKCAGEDNPMYGKHHSAETLQKMSDAKKGKHASEETRKKMSESRKGKPKTKEWRKKLGEAHKGNAYVKGMHWYNNGETCTRSFECPPGFIPGRLKRK